MGNKSNIVVQKENSLVNAIYRLSLEETRIFNYVIAKTNPENHCYDHSKDFTVKEIASFYDLENNKDIYSVFKKALKELFQRECTYYDSDKNTWTTIRLITSYSDNKEGSLSLKFSDEISELIAVRKNFLSYKLEQTKGMTSTNAIRLYEVVLHTLKKEKKKSKEFTFEEIKKFLGFKEYEYPRFANFRVRILEVAREQINKNTDITFDFSITKHGRYVTGCVLLFDWKRNAESEAKKLDDDFILEQETENIEIEEIKEELDSFGFAEASEEEIKEYLIDDLKQSIGMTNKDITYLIKMYSVKQLQNQLNNTLEEYEAGRVKKSKIAHFKYYIKTRS